MQQNFHTYDRRSQEARARLAEAEAKEVRGVGGFGSFPDFLVTWLRFG